MVDLHNLLGTLSNHRPVFHSEADFQHALAWEIHVKWSNCSLRLEYPLSAGERDRLDILAFDQRDQLAIELKYKTKPLFAPVGNEVFWLKDDGAQPPGRYHFLSDIQRLEQFVSERRNVTGYAILLTNDSAYWNPPKKQSGIDASLRIHEGRVINGVLKWAPEVSSGTVKGMEEPLTIKGTYKLTWRDYCEIELHQYVKGYRKFRYLLVKIEEE